MAGRPAKFTPYRYKIPGTENDYYGTYRYYDSNLRAIVDTGTEDMETARGMADSARAGTMLSEALASGPTEGSSHGGVSLPIRGNGTTPEGLERFAPTQANPLEALNAWATDVLPNQSNHSVSPQVPGGKPLVPVPPSPRGIVPPRGKMGARKGLSPEQVEKLTRGVKDFVVKFNLLADEAVVRLMGRQALEVTEEQVDLLKLGWELQLERLLDGVKVEPWWIIVGGNVLLIGSMYLNGEKIVKPQTKEIKPDVASSSQPS